MKSNLKFLQNASSTGRALKCASAALLILVTILLNQCGKANKAGQVGESPSDFTLITGSRTVSDSETLLIDNERSLVLQVKLEPFKVVKEFPYFFQNGKGNIMAYKEGKYFILANGRDYAIYNIVDGSFVKNPATLNNTITSSAFSPESNFVILQDAQKSLVILSLDENGAVLKTALRGPLITGKDSLAAGDIDKNGDFYTSVEENKYIKIDLKTEVAQTAWNAIASYTSIDLTAAAAGKISKITAYKTDRLFIVGKAKALTWNSTAGSEQAIANTDISAFTNSLTTTPTSDADLKTHSELVSFSHSIPHLFGREEKSEDVSVVYIDDNDKFVTKIITGVNLLLNNIKDSFLDSTNITILTRSSSKNNLNQYQLSDLRGTLNETFDSRVEIAVSKKYWVQKYPSSLGKLVRNTYDRENPVVLMGFGI